VNLIIDADLTNPPSQRISVRELTFFAHEFRGYNVLLETNSNKDFYYSYLKGIALDFIDDIVKVGEETGLRIGNSPIYAPTIIVEFINSKNINYLLKCIGML